MEIVKLNADFAKEIHELELLYYPKKFITGLETIRENLIKAEREGENLSWGIISERKLVAYLIAWIDYSMVEGREFEEIIFVDDICVSPNKEKAFFLLLQSFTDEIRNRNLQMLPIEGATRVNSFRIFSRHESLFQSLGYRLIGSHEYYDEELGEQMIWIRFESV